ncbi:MAG: DUF6624 domain-containing protein [archaeon]
MKLKEDLIKRFETDQKYSGRNVAKAEEIYRENSLWLERVIDEIGWPSQDIVGIVGEQSAWLIVQHSPDLDFQERCLKMIKDLPLTNERKEYMAYLTDRILVRKGYQQIFGTQFLNGKPFPIKEFENLDVKRKEVGLEPFEDYQKRMQK